MTKVASTRNLLEAELSRLQMIWSEMTAAEKNESRGKTIGQDIADLQDDLEYLTEE